MEKFVRIILTLALAVALLAIARTGFATAYYLEKERIVYVPKPVTMQAQCLIVAPYDVPAKRSAL